MPAAVSPREVIPYEERLHADPKYAWDEGGLHFSGKSAVQAALRRISKHLDDLKIPYAVAGAMAMFAHGLRRFTINVDILIERRGLEMIHARANELGYVPDAKVGSNLREIESGVRIKFLIAGQYPGDRKPKPVCFLDPKSVAVELNGIQYLSLPALVELKLAAGIDNPGYLKGIADAMELIKALQLPRDLAFELHPYVRDKFLELWEIWKHSPPDPHEFGTMDERP